MIRKLDRRSWDRTFFYSALVVASLAGALNFTGNSGGSARAALCCIHYDLGGGRHFPQLSGRYSSSDTIEFPGTGVVMSNFSITGPFSPSETVDAQPGAIHDVTSFFDVFAEINFFNPGSEPFIPYWPWSLSVVNPNPPDVFDLPFQTEVLGFEMLTKTPSPGGPVPLPYPVIFRESPTLASTGRHQVVPLSNGLIAFDSFFDVFFEVSIDNGASFHPASSPMHLELVEIVPEPGSVAMAVVALLGCGLITQRRKRNH